jgi:hypothetical protein
VHRVADRVLDSPLLVLAGAAVAAVAFVVLRLEVMAHGDITRFVDVGADFSDRAGLPRGVTVVPGTGYDGQFYYRLALNPADLHRSAYGITFDNAYRVQRITYSLLVFVAAAGQAGAVPYALVVVNVVGLAVLAALGALLARDCGRPAAWGLLVAGYSGFLFALGRDLTEICEACFVVATLLLLRRARPVAAGVALTAAVLSRETALLVVGAVALVSLAEVARGRRRPGRADAAWLVPVAAYVGWQLVGWAFLGSIPLRSDTENNLTYPFVSMVRAVAHNLGQLPSDHAALWLAELALLCVTTGAAGVHLTRSRARAAEKCAWVLAVLLAILLTPTLWESHADFRGFEDLYVLSCVVLLDSKAKLRVLAVLVAAVWVVTFVHRVVYF